MCISAKSKVGSSLSGLLFIRPWLSTKNFTVFVQKHLRFPYSYYNWCWLHFSLLFLKDSPLQCPSCTSYMSMDDCTRNEKTIDCGTSLTRSNYSCITSETFIPPNHANKKGALMYEKRCAKLDKCREKDVCSAYGKCKVWSSSMSIFWIN